MYRSVRFLTLFLLGVITSTLFVHAQSRLSHAQETIPFITPVFNYLGPCPSCDAPAVSPVINTVSVYPTAPSVNPSAGPYAAVPSYSPCELNSTALADHGRRHRKYKKHKHHNGKMTQDINILLQFLLELINKLLALLGQAPVGPQPQTLPVPCSPGEVPGVSTYPSAASSEAAAITPVPSASVSTSPGPSVPVPQPSGTAGDVTFNDDFNGTALDTSKWEIVDSNNTSGGYSLGGSCFVNDGQHVLVSGGNLILRATQAASPTECNGGLWNPKNYLSGFIWTRNKFSQTYGKFEMRAKLPDAKGAWPAFWMWAQEGRYNNAWAEIDILEAYDYGPYTDLGPTLHEVNGGDTKWCTINPNVSNDFHLYRMDWSANNISIYYDNQLCKTFTNWTANGLNNPQPFDQPMYMLLNLAVGMSWGANGASQTIPDNSNTWPMDMVVDYVRVWK